METRELFCPEEETEEKKREKRTRREKRKEKEIQEEIQEETQEAKEEEKREKRKEGETEKEKEKVTEAEKEKEKEREQRTSGRTNTSNWVLPGTPDRMLSTIPRGIKKNRSTNSERPVRSNRNSSAPRIQLGNGLVHVYSWTATFCNKKSSKGWVGQ